MAGDLDKLQGTWHVRSLQADGRTMPADAVTGSRIVIDGSSFTSTGMGAVYAGTIAVDETRTPRTFDLRFTAGHAAGTRHPGIYALDRDTWTICLATRGSRRPARFATRSGTGLVLETLERAAAGRKTSPRKPQKAGAAEPPSGPPTELEGEWTMVAGVMNGAEMGPDLVKWCRRLTRGNRTSVLAGPRVMLRATFTLDQSPTPQRIDYVTVEGAKAGTTQAGIFEMTAELLQICMAAPGKPRPREFLSKRGDGRSFTSWRRIST